ncbi:MAG: AmpG family muropeptide MFS transporter [Candidatus Adiutrix sp.]|nr:AmpG family muropeptide MFS transporter [Candidatus Adiutrix sp.]
MAIDAAGRRRRSLATSFFMGFTSGVPFLVTATLVQAWWLEAGLDLKAIGLLALTGLPYTFKWAWSFWLDVCDPPLFAAWGRRRGWLLLSQAALFAGLWLLSLLDPGQAGAVSALCLGLAFASATQDVVIDAYRREDLADADLAPGSAAYIWGYRLGMLAVGGGGLMAAEFLGLAAVFRLTAFLLLLGPLTLAFSPEPEAPRARPAGLAETVWRPLAQFFKRPAAGPILLFIFFYKFGDQLATSLTTAYYLTLGYEKAVIGAVSKILGTLATLAGVALGGWGAARLGLRTSLWLFGFLQMLATLGFVLLYRLPIHPASLGLVVGGENLAAGAGTSAFVAFMTGQTDRGFSASQYALLSSLMALPRTLLSAPAGWLAESLGWPWFYGLSAALALPGLVFLHYLARRRVFA